MQLMWVCLNNKKAVWKAHLKIHGGETSNKCKRCEYASLHAQNLKVNFREICINANIVILHYLVQVLWGGIWKRTVGKRQINATSASMHRLEQETWGRTWNAQWRKAKPMQPVSLVGLSPAPSSELWKQHGSASQLSVTLPHNYNGSH